MPQCCRPYLVTDAGFKNPWFKAVLALGWDYVGRVRGKVHYDEGNGFESIKNLHTKASFTAKLIGKIVLINQKKSRLKAEGLLEPPMKETGLRKPFVQKYDEEQRRYLGQLELIFWKC